MNPGQMTPDQMNREPTSFAAALRDAADTFTMPQVDQLHERAVRRGRQIKRRRAAGASVSAAIAVGAVGVLTASLLGSGAPAQSPTASGVGAHPTKAKASGPVVPPIHPGTGRYMAEHLKPLLPPDVKLDIQKGSGQMIALEGQGYQVMGSGGDWSAAALALVTYAGQHYTIQFEVKRDWTSPGCGSAQPNPDAPCTSKPLGRGTLVRNDYPGTYANNTSWLYAWSLTDGKSVRLTVNTALGSPNAPNPFTEQQIESLLTAPAWTSVLDALPQVVHCDALQPLQHGGAGWICPSTGKTYPGIADAYAYNP